METTATILHADLDAFYASVEQLLDPSLRGRPIALGGGVFLAASYEAKSFGVWRGMSGGRARELGAELTFVRGHFKESKRAADSALAGYGCIHADVKVGWLFAAQFLTAGSVRARLIHEDDRG